MPVLAPDVLGPVVMGPVVMGPAELGSSGTPSVLTLVELPPASVLAAGASGPMYWAARSGRAGHTYSNARLLLGSTGYVWWTIDGEGHDPGLDDVALDGLDGFEVELTAAALDGDDIATATAAIIDAIDGWSCTADADTLEISGPEAVTTGLAWDAATTGEMAGMRSISGTHEGPINNALAQHLPAPGIDLPLLAVDILIGGTADTSDRWRGSLYTGVGGASTPVGEGRTIDLGQLAAGQVVANGWARWHIPASSNLRGTDALWFGVKGSGNTTTVRGVLSGNALRGDWPNANLLRSDQGEPSPINPDATVAWPATWPGAVAIESGFVMGVRLIYGGTVGDASHHSATDPAVFGTHAPVADLGSSIDLDSHLYMVADLPPFRGMVGVDIGWGVGAARGTQPRLALLVGADTSDPNAPEVDGATVLVDAGQLTGSSAVAWESRSLGSVALPASASIAWAGTCNNDSTGTTIAFAQDPAQVNANPPEAPMDWLPVESSPGPAQGSEVETFPGSNPASAFPSPVSAPTPTRPRNVPAARIRFHIPGITVTS
jgi:hypothetical protein